MNDKLTLVYLISQLELQTHMHTAVPSDDQQPPDSPQGPTPEPYSFEFSKMPVTQTPGGTYKIADSTNFKVAKTIAVSEEPLTIGVISPDSIPELSPSFAVNAEV